MKRIKRNEIIESKLFERVKMILFITLLVGTYFLSTKTVDFLLELDAELLKRSLNIILVAIVVILYKK